MRPAPFKTMNNVLHSLWRRCRAASAGAGRLLVVWRSGIGGLRLAWEASPRGVAFAASISFVVALLPPALVWTGKRLVDALASGQVESVRQVMPTIGLLGLLTTAQGVLQL